MNKERKNICKELFVSVTKLPMAGKCCLVQQPCSLAISAWPVKVIVFPVLSMAIPLSSKVTQIIAIAEFLWHSMATSVVAAARLSAHCPMLWWDKRAG